MGENQALGHSFLEEDGEDGPSDETFDKFILLKDLEKYTFSPGIITWKKKFVLSSAGELLNHSYLKKFTKVTDRLSCDFISRPWNINQFCELFSELQSAKTIHEKHQTRLKVLSWFRPIYWTGQKDVVFAELMEGAHKTFYDLPKDLEDKLRSSNEDLFRVYALKASLFVVFSLSLGIIEFKYLKELYHLPFYFYISLKENLSYHLVESMKFEWENKGEAKEYLENCNAHISEIEFFKENPLNSLKEYKKNSNDNSQFYSCHLSLEKSHERKNGKGGPKGLKLNELSDLENLLVFICSCFGVEDICPTRKNYNKKLEEIILNNTKINPRLKNILTDTFNEMTLKS